MKAMEPLISDLSTITLSEIEERIGTLSNPSKMPCYSYGLPAGEQCLTGSRLINEDGTVCSSCYARKGFYVFPSVYAAQWKRLDAVRNDKQWGPLITELIRRKERSGYFRWFDSGDLQSLRHLRAIVQVAHDLPRIRFWLPTKEPKLVNRYCDIRGSKGYPMIPRNLTIRISAKYVGQSGNRADGILGSSVNNPKAFQCEAKERDNHCGDCRECWLKRRKDISYPIH